MAMATPRTMPHSDPTHPLSARSQFGLIKTPRPNGSTVPFLPGHVVHDVTKTRHPLNQTLQYRLDGGHDGLRPDAVIGTKPADLTMEHLKAMSHPAYRINNTGPIITHEDREAAKESARNTTRPPNPPAWLKHDRQVLKFFAYFQEPVHENPNENFRLRHCVLLFYLEDGTMQITEPKMENSGIPQGAFVKRHRIPKPSGGFFEPKDLKCGETISVYARVFQIYSCDEFTKFFYENSLLDIGNIEEAPVDNFHCNDIQKKMIEKRQHGGVTRDVVEGKEYVELMLGGSRKNAKLQQYLANDRKVLRFNCYWDDHTRYGTRLYYVFHYFLSDDTVEISECYARNSGRDPYPIFWRRSPLRKNPVISPTPAMLEPEAVLYKPVDLIVGKSVVILGRELVIYECDDFTRKFYMDYLDVEQPSHPIEQPEQVHIQLSHPPHTGFGSQEDSLASCIALRPKPPRKDLVKLMTCSDQVLRFEACMRSANPEDSTRRFIIGIFLADDSVAVWELRQRNSGHAEGKFAERSKKTNRATGTGFKPADFFIGADIAVNSVPFHIYKADEYTLQFMETHPDIFPLSDKGQIAAKIAAIKHQLSPGSYVEPERFRQMVKDATGVAPTDQELITIVRNCAAPGTSSIHTDKLVQMLGAA